MSDPAIDYMASRGISEATCLAFGLEYNPDLHAVAFPYYDVLGRVRMCRWRRLRSEDEPKYLNSKGTQLRLYNVEDTEAPGPVYICEGEIDTLSLKEMGHSAVGVPGAQAFNPAWRWLFVDREVVVAFDADRAGTNGAARIAAHLTGLAESVRVLRFPEGEDVNSLYTSGRIDDMIGGRP